MDKTPIGARFIVVPKNEALSHSLIQDSKFSKWFLILYKVFITKAFLFRLLKFWIVQNSFPIVIKLNKINVKKKANSISTFDLSTLYTVIPYKLFIRVLLKVINFVFKSKVRKHIGFSKTYIYHCTKNEVFHKDFFSKCDHLQFPAIWSHLLKKSLMENFIFCAV